MRVAILDDTHGAYEGTLGVRRLRDRAEVRIFTDPFGEPLALRGFDAVVANRERTRFYKLRWRIESAFNRLKDFKRIATRYDKLARNYLASVCLAAALVWWIQ
jgi:hypothetical protein